jgi:hypothetical protein
MCHRVRKIGTFGCFSNFQFHILFSRINEDQIIAIFAGILKTFRSWILAEIWIFSMIFIFKVIQAQEFGAIEF